MILFDGELLPDVTLEAVARDLSDYCIKTIDSREITAQEVIEACASLSDRIRKGAYDELLYTLKKQGRVTEQQLQEAAALFDRKNLEYKYQTELGGLTGGAGGGKRYYMPLGILFHIAAGNAQGLPFYSVVEGLLTGNINILKLPSGDDGLSVFLLKELVRLKPGLSRHIIVLDVPSTNKKLMQSLGQIADAIVVWGGDEAVRAVREMADLGTRIISWGHKLSFAYAVQNVKEEELRKLAGHICATNQLLCSSCQGIFVDTEDMAVVRALGKRFLTLLEEESLKYPELSLEIRGKVGIALYNDELENLTSKRELLRGKGASVTLADDHVLEASHMFRNCWVKPLPRTKILKALKPYRGYLQTAGLLCHEKDRIYLGKQLLKAGVVRITGAGGMSAMAAGGAHDGEYPLRRYCRIVEVEAETG